MLWLGHPAHMSLIYRGSSQGINPAAFHAKCDKKGPTLTLLKSEHGKVFGGFTSVSWRSPSKPTCVKDPRAFIFSLDKQERFDIKHVNGSAVVHFKEYMPVFGRDTLRDIFIQRNESRKPNNNTHDLGSNYRLPRSMVIGSKVCREYLSGTDLLFKLEDIEVYSVLYSS
jgi:hypothetical protein